MTVSAAISWPAAAATPPRAPLRAAIARVVFEHAAGRVPVRVSYPGGRVLGAGTPASPGLEVVRPAAFLARLGRDATTGFGEAYMAGDWRAGPGTDAIVSVEMIEAVGEAYRPACFTALDRLLAPGGTAAIQAITMDHQRFLATRRSFSRIQKYIFPGGIIPSLQAVDDALAARTTLRVTRRRELGPHYARTLHLWRERFGGQWPRIHAQGFDETFRRMWEFCLAYSEAGFRSGYLGVSQLQMTRVPA